MSSATFNKLPHSTERNEADPAAFNGRSRDFGDKSPGKPIALLKGMDQPLSPNRARTIALQRRSFDLTCAIIRAYPRKQHLDEPDRIIWRNLIRAASSSTFNLEEADAASSDADFISKMRITLREAKEAHVSLRIITTCELAGFAQTDGHRDEANQLAAIFRTIIKNKQRNVRNKGRDSSTEH